ncbi:addiction module antidote protein [Microbulbifer rhizosphaerae]|uniref:Putative addiction module antidote protein n=1 Tax=Microbulbifer rhizosphaerae TaxID=1562603 RepID=A0A7W4WEK6_9GAMM|nr:addiction module antidote protein [Microbulbifer rhizosphaerae]MBB3062824.1 putative addiction module antidote protein [Microbulbifer rhizosphaerae]
MDKLQKSVPYDPATELKTPEDIAAYLDAAMEDEDEQVLLMALRHAATAIGGMSELSRRTGLSRETLYRTLSSSGNPKFSTLRAILKAFGLTISVHAA